MSPVPGFCEYFKSSYVPSNQNFLIHIYLSEFKALIFATVKVVSEHWVCPINFHFLGSVLEAELLVKSFLVS